MADYCAYCPKIHLLGPPGFPVAARLWAALGAKGQAEHTGCFCGTHSHCSHRTLVCCNTWFRSLRMCDSQHMWDWTLLPLVCEHKLCLAEKEVTGTMDLSL